MNASSNESSVYSDGAEIPVLITSTSINIALGIPVNAVVLWLLLTTRGAAAGTTLASEIFTLNLSICELLFILMCILNFIKAVKSWLFGFMLGFFFTGRPLFQSCMCVERLVAVVRPVLFLRWKPLRYRLACSAVAWAIIAGVSLTYMLLLDGGYITYLIMGECLAFMSVMLLCSLAILKALRQAGPGEEGAAAGRETERDNALKKRAFTIICLILVSFVGTYCAWCLALVLSGEGKTPDIATNICYSMTVISGTVQPLLYICQKTGKLPCFKPTQGS